MILYCALYPRNALTHIGMKETHALSSHMQVYWEHFLWQYYWRWLFVALSNGNLHYLATVQGNEGNG